MLRWRIPARATTGYLFNIHLGQRAQAFVRQEGRQKKQRSRKSLIKKITGGFEKQAVEERCEVLQQPGTCAGQQAECQQHAPHQASGSQALRSEADGSMVLLT